MTIEFKRETVKSKYLDPTRNFEENELSIELRTDPLTKYNALIYPFRFRKLEKPDLSELIEKSLKLGCPFCPESIDKVTPKFLPDLFPEGRVRLGEACLVPNLLPYSPYSGLVVLSSQHFMGLPDFTEETIVNGLQATQIYLKRIFDYDPEAKYYSILWNHMPIAGGSQIHPHLHVGAGYSPTAYQRQLLEASHQYSEQNFTNFWSDLIAEEKKLGERYIGSTGNIAWLTSFVPKGWLLDVMAIFQGKDSILNLSRKDLEEFSNGLKRVFSYMNDLNFYSFNLSIYSGINGEDSFGAHARIVPRFTLPPVDAADSNAYRVLHDEFASFVLPEDNCSELKQYFLDC